MKKRTQYGFCCIPMALLFVIIPMVVKLKFLSNPLIEVPWYVGDEIIADFFLYYKSWLVTLTGVLMLFFCFGKLGK